jgi:hypothetical protein
MTLVQKCPSIIRAKRPSMRLAGVALALVAMQAPSWALGYVWLGGTGDWNLGGNWSFLGVPGSNDTARIESGTAILDSAADVLGLTLAGGTLSGSGTLSTDSLTFQSGAISVASFGVSSSTRFNGASSLVIGRNTTLNLNGNSTWTAGSGGSIVVNQGGTGSFNIGAGTVFTDEGAASAAGNRDIGNNGSQGGAFNNLGTYDRNGLGSTRTYNFNNSGNFNINEGTVLFYSGTSNGQINIASGASLIAHGTSTFSGAIANNGTLHFASGSIDLTPNTVITGNVRMASTGSGVSVTSAGLTFDTLDFGSATLEGTSTTVRGLTTLRGASSLALGRNTTLNLNGNTTWTVGSGGSIVVNQGGTGSFNIGAGTVFTDEGAASADGNRDIGNNGSQGGAFNNLGTYDRNGLGSTRAANFRNVGTLNVNEGRFVVSDEFNNSGVANVHAGAVLHGSGHTFQNLGTIRGNGTIRTPDADTAFVNSGTLDPGLLGELGMLTLDGDLSMTDSARLRIDLGIGLTADRLTITDDVIWSGELAIWSVLGANLQVGDTYTVATFDQRLSASTFDRITWHGLDTNLFVVEYNPHDITLRVVSLPVPETASWGQLLVGLCGLTFVSARRRKARE